MAECAGTHRQGRLRAIALLALCMATLAAAQSAIGGIAGRRNGRVVVGALVTVERPGLRARNGRPTRRQSAITKSRNSSGVGLRHCRIEILRALIGEVELVRHVMARLDATLVIRHTERITVHGDAIAPALATADLSVGTTFARGHRKPAPGRTAAQSSRCSCSSPAWSPQTRWDPRPVHRRAAAHGESVGH